MNSPERLRQMDEQRQREIEETLSRVRKTVADSRDLMNQVNLRMQETDRMLAKQGLTREQVRNFHFTPEQKLLVNQELKRRGLPVLEGDRTDFDSITAEIRASQIETVPDGEDVVSDRQRKFGNFMREFRL